MLKRVNFSNSCNQQNTFSTNGVVFNHQNNYVQIYSIQQDFVVLNSILSHKQKFTTPTFVQYSLCLSADPLGFYSPGFSALTLLKIHNIYWPKEQKNMLAKLYFLRISASSFTLNQNKITIMSFSLPNIPTDFTRYKPILSNTFHKNGTEIKTD